MSNPDWDRAAALVDEASVAVDNGDAEAALSAVRSAAVYLEAAKRTQDREVTDGND